METEQKHHGDTKEKERKSESREIVMGERKKIEEMKKELFNLDGFAVNGVAWFSWK